MLIVLSQSLRSFQKTGKEVKAPGMQTFHITYS